MSKDFQLGETVKFVRMSAPGTPVYGEGMIVAKLIGISKRVNYSVKEPGTGEDGRTDKAWNLEAEALNGTEEQNSAYVEHHANIQAIVSRYEALSTAAVKATNETIEAAHTAFFGPPLIV